MVSAIAMEKELVSVIVMKKENGLNYRDEVRKWCQVSCWKRKMMSGIVMMKENGDS